MKLIPQAQCSAGYTQLPDGSCCSNRFISADGKFCETDRQRCPPGEARNEHRVCLTIPSTACPSGQFHDDGVCRQMPFGSCPSGELRNREGNCEAIVTPECPRGEVRNEGVDRFDRGRSGRSLTGGDCATPALDEFLHLLLVPDAGSIGCPVQ